MVKEKQELFLIYAKEYGASVIALTIDEGYGKNMRKKLAIIKRIYQLVVHEFKIHPEDLIFDPLTFTLGSGDEEFRKSAIATLDSIKLIKETFLVSKLFLVYLMSVWPHSYTRQLLNSLMLYHAVKMV